MNSPATKVPQSQTGATSDAPTRSAGLPPAWTQGKSKVDDDIRVSDFCPYGAERLTARNLFLRGTRKRFLTLGVPFSLLLDCGAE